MGLILLSISFISLDLDFFSFDMFKLYTMQHTPIDTTFEKGLSSSTMEDISSFSKVILK